MERWFKWSIKLLSCAVFLLVQSSTAQAVDYKVTNEVDISGNIVLPNNKYLRGDAFFELTMSPEHLKRAEGSCPGLKHRGMTAFKLVGGSEEWERSFASQQAQTNPYGISFKRSDGSYSGIFVNPAGSPQTIGGVTTWIYGYGFGNMIFEFSTKGWRGGDYTLIGFMNDGCRDYSMVTKKFTLPEIPKTQLKCQFPNSSYQNELFQVICSSSLDLAANGVLVEVKEGNSWSKLASEVAVGQTHTFKAVKLEKLGTSELRVRLVGIQDTIQDSVSDSSFIQVNPAKLDLTPYLEIAKSSKESPAQIQMNTGNNALTATLQSSNTPNGPWSDEGPIRSAETTSKNIPFGHWVRVVYEGNSAINKGISEPFQVLITPKLSCNFPGSITSGKKFQTTCSSNQNLQATPITLQYQDSFGNWVSVDKGSIGGTKKTFTYALTGQGTQKLRIRSEGLRDFYTAFASNVSQVKFIAAKSSSTTSSGPGSGAIPRGKVDKSSNAYKFMFTFGQNLSAKSLATDSALSQCLSAKNSGLVKVRGIPTYLGPQATQIQSYLKTASGFQGCLDGFGS